MRDPELEELARRLEAHEDYRVIRRLARQHRYHSPDQELIAAGKLKLGIFLDVETTGLDPATDHVIELGLVPFEFSSDGRIFAVPDGYDGLRDPGVPIPAEISALTGITDDMVRGKQLDDATIEALVVPAHLVVAHNAGFDRPFAEQLHEVFASKAWGCSMSEVPWREQGFEGGKLEYLAYRFGFFFDGHRASDDCIAGIHLLAQTLPGPGTSALAALLASARTRTIRLWAEGSPYEHKDKLRRRGYRWHAGEDGRPRSWYRDVAESTLDDEQAFLRDEIFGGRLPDLPRDLINAFNRYSARV